MTKKRGSSSSRKTTRSKKSSGSALSRLLVFILIIGALFIGNQLGLIDVNWQELLEGDLQAVLTGDEAATAGQPAEPANESASTQPVVAQPVSGEWYRLYFTSPQFPDEPATRVDTISPGLIEVVNSAQKSLDIAIYELNLEPVGDAILAARDRGAAVRIVTDSDELEELETLIRLEEEGIPIIPDERSAIMHNKFVVVDGQAVWTGSWNFTPNDTFRNNNHGIYIQSPELAQNYTTEFEEMFNDQAFGPTSPANTPYPQIQLGDTLLETCFAPEDDCADQLIQLINQAQRTIHFMAFSFTHVGVGDAVRDRASAGVEVRGVFERRGSETEHSELGAMRDMKLDTLQDGNPYTLHHKVFVVDGAIVVLGSFNFSQNADEANDENLLIIHNNALANEFLGEFERVYAQAQNPPNE